LSFEFIKEIYYWLVVSMREGKFFEMAFIIRLAFG